MHPRTNDPSDNNVGAPDSDRAPGAGIPFDNEPSAVRGGASRLTGIAANAQTSPDIIFSATPVPALPSIVMIACSFIPAQ